MVTPISSIFCCAGERDLSLGEQGDSQHLGRPGPDVGGATDLHRPTPGGGRDFGRDCAEAEQQLGEAAARLVLLMTSKETKSH
jgi:hypothetical protein